MIREATPDDFNDLMRMAEDFHDAAQYGQLATFEDSKSGWRGCFARCFDSIEATCIVAAGSEGLVGCGVVCSGSTFFNPNVRVAQGLVLWVDPHHRKQGVGGEIIEAGIKWALSQGAVTMSVVSTIYSHPKIVGKLYREHKFKTAGRIYHRRIP